jgi:hypothetical protein
MQNLYYGICGTFLKSAFGAKNATGGGEKKNSHVF